jgi:tetratricopeptide (TPR) repeat protein
MAVASKNSKAIKLAELSITSALILAQEFLDNKEDQKAKKLYDAILIHDPANLEAKKKLSLLNRIDANLSSAQPPLDKVKEIYDLINKNEFDSVVTRALSLLNEFPGTIGIWKVLGLAYRSSDNTEEAVKVFNKLTVIEPLNIDHYYNLSASLNELGEFNDAIAACEKAISINPQHASIYFNMGNSLRLSNKLQEAVKAYKKAISFKDNYLDAYINMGNTLRLLGKYEEAIAAHNVVVSKDQSHSPSYNNLGNIYREQGKLEKSIKAYRKALSFKGAQEHITLNLSFALLNNGNLLEGLEKYEARWNTDTSGQSIRLFSQPIWTKHVSLENKTILVWGEQGPQDMVIWSSCLILLSQLAGSCIVECREKLVPLFTRSFPEVEVRKEDRTQDNTRNDFDYHLPMGSLFNQFIPEISSNYHQNKFLVPDPDRVKYWTERLQNLGEGPFIGISWTSPVLTPTRAPNYTNVNDWKPVFSLSSVTFINLQSTNFSDDLASIRSKFGVTVHNFPELDHYDDLDDVAALTTALDLVISVSTAVAAISAGVGTPTKLALWRQSPWNNILLTPTGPLVERYERNSRESWKGVFTNIARDIRQD